jgi:superfamily I DNA/RNA helicase
MLAEGIAPKSIAAVTFTELAASELLIRVRDFVSDLSAGQIPPELRIALLGGLVGHLESPSRGSERCDRRDHLFDHPRLLPAPDQTLSSRG